MSSMSGSAWERQVPASQECCGGTARKQVLHGVVSERHCLCMFLKASFLVYKIKAGAENPEVEEAWHAQAMMGLS